MNLQTKLINGKEYKYAVKSIRLPNGNVAKLEVRFKGQIANELKEIFVEKEKQLYFKFVCKNLKPDHILTESEFEKIESIRVDFKNLMRKLPKENIKDLLDRFAANFTYESNALEGNSLTLKDVAIIMFEGLSIEGKDLREIYETRNSRIVIEMILKNKFSINHQDIVKIHKLLVKDIDIRTGYKKIQNIILGRDIETTVPEKVYSEMEKLINWYQENKNKVHPIKLAALFHGKFESIHPFEDGNGRVGRFLINIILVNNKYPPLIIRKSQRVSYLKALENFDKKHFDSLERFMLERFKETYKKFFEIYVKYV